MKTVSEIDMHSSNDELYRIIAEATSSTKGKPVITIRDTVNRALHLTNTLLHVMYEDEIQLLKPTIDETEFSLPFRCGVHHSPDIRYGSQSENTLLSLALSLSLASSVTPYNCYLIDEIDAYLDQAAKDGFVSMLQEIMVRLNSEQIFIISHSVCADQYPDYVQTVDISKRIEELK
jgi:DNA repair exonuclease SbcCD ATPase subunit